MGFDIKDETCKFYRPWNEADPNPLAIDECMDWGYYSGMCLSELSDYLGQICPFGGRPNKENPEDWRDAP